MIIKDSGDWNIHLKNSAHLLLGDRVIYCRSLSDRRSKSDIIYDPKMDVLKKELTVLKKELEVLW